MIDRQCPGVTPGEWRFSFESIDPEWAIITNAHGLVIANVNADSKQAANARFIAIAPAMYSALVAAEEALAVRSSERTADQVMEQAALEEVRRVIGRARGEQ